MEKRKWLWKKRFSSETESSGSGSISSHSAGYSDEQDATRESQNESTLSPDMTSRASPTDDSVKVSVEKLSSALVNISAKEDLVKQAMAGWEKAEKEVAALKEQLDRKAHLDIRASHLDGALKECVRQLRQVKDDLERKEKEWELSKAEFERQICDLQAQLEAATAKNLASTDPKSDLLVTLQNENAHLKQELALLCKELETVAIERDLTARAAEAASKLQLQSVQKVVKLEAKYQRLWKSSPVNNQKPVAMSFPYPELVMDGCSDCSDRAGVLDIDACRNPLYALDKPMAKSPFEIDMMDDFLEMERLVGMPKTKSDESVSTYSPSKPKLDLMVQRAAELEKKLEKVEAEKSELELALDESRGSHEEVRRRMVECEAELHASNELNESLKSQLIGVGAEARAMSASVDSLRAEIDKERIVSLELRAKCRDMENEQTREVCEPEIERNTDLNSKPKVKEEDLAATAKKLADCQKTISSLGRQLKSLATLEDFLVDTQDIPGLDKVRMVMNDNVVMSKAYGDLDLARTSRVNGSCRENENVERLSPLSLSAKSRSGFGRIFSRARSVRERNNRQE